MSDTIATGLVPLVSVVVPFVESQKHLGACVDALLAQDAIEGPIEIILVDNSSSDNAGSAPVSHPQVFLLRERTPGAYAARNTGITHSRGPIVAFTDADCVVDRHWVRAIWTSMRDPAVAIVVGECQYPARASLTLRLLAAYENAKAEYVLSRCASANHFAYANNMAVRASVFAELGPFREWPRAADSELMHRLAARRPDLRSAYDPSMRVTHLEFLRARDRVKRLSLYTQTNARIDSFRELSLAQRAGVIVRLLRRRGGGET